MADKPKRRSKAVSPRIRKAITDAQLLKKNALVQKLDREAKTNKPKRISKAVSPRIRKAITDAQLLKKNLSPQVLKFVKTKMQRTGLPRVCGWLCRLEEILQESKGEVRCLDRIHL